MKSGVAKHHGCKRVRHCGLLANGAVKRIEIFLFKKYELLLRSVTNLGMLREPQQHGYDHLPLRLHIFA